MKKHDENYKEKKLMKIREARQTWNKSIFFLKKQFSVLVKQEISFFLFLSLLAKYIVNSYQNLIWYKNNAMLHVDTLHFSSSLYSTVVNSWCCLYVWIPPLSFAGGEADYTRPCAEADGGAEEGREYVSSMPPWKKLHMPEVTRQVIPWFSSTPRPPGMWRVGW